MENDNRDIITCEECNNTVKHYHRFCYNCGGYLHKETELVSIFNNSALQAGFFFYMIYLFICLSVKFTNWFSSYDRLFWIEILLGTVTIYFARANWKSIKPVLRFNNFSWLLLSGVILSATMFSTVVNIFINEINISVFRTNISLFESYRIYEFPVLLMIYSIAVVPALFEELAFRGVLYNYFATFLDERLVVLATAFVFAAVHLNFFSLIWLIPFGIFIGTLRRRYNTIWYGVIFHFIFNVTACLFDLYRQGELW